MNQFRKEPRRKRSLQILKAITRNMSHIDFCLCDSNLKTSNDQNARRLVYIHRAAPFPSISYPLCDACSPIAFYTAFVSYKNLRHLLTASLELSPLQLRSYHLLHTIQCIWVCLTLFATTLLHAHFPTATVPQTPPWLRMRSEWNWSSQRGRRGMK